MANPLLPAAGVVRPLSVVISLSQHSHEDDDSKAAPSPAARSNANLDDIASHGHHARNFEQPAIQFYVLREVGESFAIGNVAKARVSREQVCGDTGNYVYNHSISLELSLPANERGWLIVPTTFKGKLGDFVLEVCSSERLVLEKRNPQPGRG